MKAGHPVIFSSRHHEKLKDLAAKQLIHDASNSDRSPRRRTARHGRAKKGAGLATLELIPGAKIVRAFNAINYMKLRDGAGGANAKVGMPMAGDDAGAVTIASKLVRDAGLELAVGGLLPRSVERWCGTRSRVW